MSQSENTQRVVVVGPNLPVEHAKGAMLHVHAEGCADLKRGWIAPYARMERVVYEVASRYDLEAEIYYYADESDTEEYEYTLGDYQSEFHFAPCVTLPLRSDREETKTDG